MLEVINFEEKKSFLFRYLANCFFPLIIIGCSFYYSIIIDSNYFFYIIIPILLLILFISAYYDSKYYIYKIIIKENILHIEFYKLNKLMKYNFKIDDVIIEKQMLIKKFSPPSYRLIIKNKDVKIVQYPLYGNGKDKWTSHLIEQVHDYLIKLQEEENIKTKMINQ